MNVGVKVADTLIYISGQKFGLELWSSPMNYGHKEFRSLKQGVVIIEVGNWNEITKCLRSLIVPMFCLLLLLKEIRQP